MSADSKACQQRESGAETDEGSTGANDCTSFYEPLSRGQRRTTATGANDCTSFYHSLYLFRAVCQWKNLEWINAKFFRRRLESTPSNPPSPYPPSVTTGTPDMWVCRECMLRQVQRGVPCTVPGTKRNGKSGKEKTPGWHVLWNLLYSYIWVSV